jgi:uncharacterized protein YoaH (UPF0181 family)
MNLKLTNKQRNPSDILREMASAPLPKAMLAKLKREHSPREFERFKREGITVGEAIQIVDEIQREKKQTKPKPKQKRGSRRK